MIPTHSYIKRLYDIVLLAFLKLIRSPKYMTIDQKPKRRINFILKDVEGLL